MRTASKVMIVVVLPLLVLASYQFFTIHETFNVIESVRSGIFVDSAREVKHANDVLYLTSVLNSNLFEIHTAAELRDGVALSRAIRTYREIQLQRYHALQKLKEAVAQQPSTTFDFLVVLDNETTVQVQDFENEISELDALNEQIIQETITLKEDESTEDISAWVQESNELTRILTGDLATFVNERYVKIENTSKLVGQSEVRAENTLNMVLFLGYLLAGMLVLFLYVLIIQPLERFVRAIELQSMEKVSWSALDPIRRDEVGIIYQKLSEWYGPHARKTSAPRKRKTKKKKSPAA